MTVWELADGPAVVPVTQVVYPDYSLAITLLALESFHGIDHVS